MGHNVATSYTRWLARWGCDQRSGNCGNDKMTYTANEVIVAAIVASKEASHAHKVSSVAALAHLIISCVYDCNQCRFHVMLPWTPMRASENIRPLRDC